MVIDVLPSSEGDKLSSISEDSYKEPSVYIATVNKKPVHFSVNLDSEESSEPTRKELTQHTPKESTHEKPDNMNQTTKPKE